MKEALIYFATGALTVIIGVVVGVWLFGDSDGPPGFPEPPAKGIVEGYLWPDDNPENGVIDEGDEVPYDDKTVELYRALKEGGYTAAGTEQSDEGHYRFEDVSEGCYKVETDFNPPGLVNPGPYEFCANGDDFQVIQHFAYYAATP